VSGEAEAGAALAAHDDVDKISFTGSTAVGRQIQQAAAGNLKRLSLELGGKSANIVLEDADIDAAVEGAMRATFRNQGQVCTAGGRLVAHASLADELAERLAERVRGLESGPLVSARPLEHELVLYVSAFAECAHALGGG